MSHLLQLQAADGKDKRSTAESLDGSLAGKDGRKIASEVLGGVAKVAETISNISDKRNGSNDTKDKPLKILGDVMDGLGGVSGDVAETLNDADSNSSLLEKSHNANANKPDVDLSKVETAFENLKEKL